MKPFNEIKAFIFDLDGVITQTRKIHKISWKLTLNDFLRKRRNSFHLQNENLADFNKWQDYDLFIDGRTREDGIRSFLESRNILIDNDHVNSISQCKNLSYNKLLIRYGVNVISSSESFIFQLFKRGVPMAVVSSSQNTKVILSKSKMLHYFQVVVFPENNKNKYFGKPHPDSFLRACRFLSVSPQESCLVEDSVAGIIAAKKAKFGRIVGFGIERETCNYHRFKNIGADEIVSSLWDIRDATSFLSLPDGLKEIALIESLFSRYILVLSIDRFTDPVNDQVNDQEKSKLILDAYSKKIKDFSQKKLLYFISSRDTSRLREVFTEANFIQPDGFFNFFSKLKENEAPFLIGAQESDEKLFREILLRGVCIKIQPMPGATFAHYKLDDFTDILKILKILRNKWVNK